MLELIGVRSVISALSAGMSIFAPGFAIAHSFGTREDSEFGTQGNSRLLAHPGTGKRSVALQRGPILGPAAGSVSNSADERLSVDFSFEKRPWRRQRSHR